MVRRALLRRHSPDFTFRDFPDPLPEPWRQHPLAGDCWRVPVAFVLKFTDPVELSNKASRDAQHVADLYLDIQQNGITTPLEMWIDQRGKIRLHEGHHRMAAIVRLGDIQLVPVLIKRSSGTMRGYGRTAHDEIETILSNIGR